MASTPVTAKIEIEQTIFHVVGSNGLIGAWYFQLQAGFGSLHFVTHGAQGLVIVFLIIFLVLGCGAECGRSASGGAASDG